MNHSLVLFITVSLVYVTESCGFIVYNHKPSTSAFYQQISSSYSTKKSSTTSTNKTLLTFSLNLYCKPIENEQEIITNQDNHVTHSVNYQSVSSRSPDSIHRKTFLKHCLSTLMTSYSLVPALITSITSISTVSPLSAQAAPPIAIIAEELGYFPVTNKEGDTIYIPAKVKSKSTEQSLKLASFLRDNGAVMYGAFWCPHCQHQKELFGKEAWSLISYVECSPKGYGYKSNLLKNIPIEGFPTWKLPRYGKKRNGIVDNNRFTGKENYVSGEMPLVDIAKLTGYPYEFDPALETNAPSLGSNTSCN